MISTQKIILEYVAPSLGTIFANMMWTAPYKAVKEAILRGYLGVLNPTPWAFMTGNCTGWVTYSFLKQDIFVFLANVTGLIISFWLNMCAAKLQYQNHRATHIRNSFVSFVTENRSSLVVATTTTATPTETGDTTATADIAKMILRVTAQDIQAPAPHETIVMVIIIAWILIISIISFSPFSLLVKQYIVGISVNINLLFFYGAPLSVIFKVLKRRNAVFIHRWTMVANTLNGIFWTAYGFSIGDFMIFVPNGLGALFGFIQMCLLIIFPTKEEVEGVVADEESEAATLKAVSEENLVGEQFQNNIGSNVPSVELTTVNK